MNLTISVEGTKCTFKWDSVPKAEQYRVQQKSGSKWNTVIGLPVSGLSWGKDFVKGTYTFRVLAVSFAPLKTINTSNEVSVTTGVEIPPPPPPPPPPPEIEIQILSQPIPPVKEYKVGMFLLDFQNNIATTPMSEYKKLGQMICDWWSLASQGVAKFTLDVYDWVTISQNGILPSDDPQVKSSWTYVNVGYWDEYNRLTNNRTKAYSRLIYVAKDYPFAQGGGNVDGFGMFQFGNLPNLSNFFGGWSAHAHEFGHLLGLGHSCSLKIPNDDGSYETLVTDRTRWKIYAYGGWGLMGSGGSMINAFEREKLGWINPVPITKSGNYRIYASEISKNPNCAKIVVRDNTNNASFTYWLETRRKVGIDAGVVNPIFGGLLVNGYSDPPIGVPFLAAGGPLQLDMSPKDGRGIFSSTYPLLEVGTSFICPFSSFILTVIKDDPEYTDFRIEFKA